MTKGEGNRKVTLTLAYGDGSVLRFYPKAYALDFPLLTVIVPSHHAKGLHLSERFELVALLVEDYVNNAAVRYTGKDASITNHPSTDDDWCVVTIHSSIWSKVPLLELW